MNEEKYFAGNFDEIFLFYKTGVVRTNTILTAGAALCTTMKYGGYLLKNPKSTKADQTAHFMNSNFSNAKDFSSWILEHPEMDGKVMDISNFIEENPFKGMNRDGIPYGIIGGLWKINGSLSGLSEAAIRAIDDKYCKGFDFIQAYPDKRDPLIQYFEMIRLNAYGTPFGKSKKTPAEKQYMACCEYWGHVLEYMADIDASNTFTKTPTRFIKAGKYSIPYYATSRGAIFYDIRSTLFRHEFPDAPVYLQARYYENPYPRMRGHLLYSVITIDDRWIVPPEFSFRMGSYIEEDMPYGILFVEKERRMISFDTLTHAKEYLTMMAKKLG